MSNLADELCTCEHPRRQHMSTTGPCCHVEATCGGIQLTCEDCQTFTPMAGDK